MKKMHARRPQVAMDFEHAVYGLGKIGAFRITLILIKLISMQIVLKLLAPIQTSVTNF